MRIPTFLLVYLSLLVSVVVPHAGADTVLHYTSEAGDYIGKGQERTVTPAGGFTFAVNGSSSNYVSFYITNFTGSNSQFYGLEFSAPVGSTLAVGDYPQATRYPFQAAGSPGLNFDANGSGSNELTGQFQILEISFDANGKLATFAANFAQHSENAVPACYGQIRYNSSLPYLTPSGVGQLAANHYSVFAPAGSLVVAATRRDGSAGALTVNYSTVDGTALAGRDYTTTTGTLSWAAGDTANKTFTVPILNSGNPYQGNTAFYINLSGAGTGAQTQATVAVVNDNSAVTFVHFVSEAGDYIGQGQERTFSIATSYVLNASRNFDGGVSFSFNGPQYWNLDLAAATGTIFGLGDYQDAQRFPFQESGHPGLSLSGDGRGSNTLTGNFQVLEAEFDGNGAVLKFAANFEQHSEGGIPGLYGQVRYNSTVPVPSTPGAAQFAAASYSALENTGKVALTVNRAGGKQGALSVNYATTDGTAKAGVNYTAANGTLTWAAGDSAAKTITVPVLDDGRYTDTLTFSVVLTGERVGSPAAATVLVINQDLKQPGTVQFSAATYAANSTDGQATISVRRVGGSYGALNIKYNTADDTAFAGINYTGVSGALTWVDGEGGAKTFVVPLLNPVSAQANQSLTLNLSGSNVGAPSKASLTIRNANFPPVGMLALSTVNYAANEGDGTATISVNRVGGSYGPLSASYATADGTALRGRDYLAVAGILSWESGDNSPKLFTVPILNGHVGDGGTRALLIRLTGASVGAVPEATLTITDNAAPPLPTVTVLAAAPQIREEGGAPGAFIISRTGDVSAPLTVAYSVKGSAVNGQDYQTLKGAKTIKAGKSSVRVKVKPIDSGADGGKAVVKFSLLPPADGGYAVGTPGDAKLKILR